ncbi:MAG: hypothetical protein ACLF0P_14165 [Thermoanaerobaculia bacterium]
MRTEAALALWLLPLAALVAAGPAGAEIGTLDDVPAATLLLPYFEVDPTDDVPGATTLFSIRNASAAPVVAHVTIWSNLGVPVLSFDVYLTGYDSEWIDLHAALVDGFLPLTAPTDDVSPRGDRSEPHDDFGGTCSRLPFTEPGLPALPASLRAHLRSWLTGEASSVFGGSCAGAPTDLMTGYITVDAVDECNLLFPSDAGYFEPGGTGIASNRNVLWGDWFFADVFDDFAYGGSLVHIEASGEDPRTSTPGARTFYGRFVEGSAADNREPLSSTWLASIAGLDLPDGDTELLVWRDSGVAQTDFPCGSLPAEFPLPTEGSTVYDPEGGAAPFPSDALPWETQRIPLEEPSGSGLALDLDASTGGPFGPDQQGHVTVLQSGSGLFSTASGAVQGDPGVLGTPDAAPGATLLLPYFEMDLEDPTRVRTLARIHNAAPEPVLARAVLWTDLGIPTLGFDLHLPGHGSRTLDLAELFTEGELPASGPAARPSCSGRLPPAPLAAGTLDGLRAAHSGQASGLFDDRCAGHDHGGRMARGYLTVDVTTACTDSLPGDPGYFGLLGFEDVLWGEGVTLDAEENSARAERLVPLQASTDDPLTTAEARTFYGRYTAGTAADHREALPSRWSTGFWESGFQETEARIWRDTGRLVEPFDCDLGPSGVPLGQGVSLRFDEDGFDGALPSPVAALATQRTVVPQPSVPGPFGWLFLDLDAWTGGPFGTRLQAHVGWSVRDFGRFDASMGSVHLPIAFGSAAAAVATDPEAVEGSPGTPGTADPGEISIGRTGPVDQALEVLVGISGTAEHGTDYELFADGSDPLPVGGGPISLTIPAGASTLPIRIAPLPDSDIDENETVVLTVEPGLAYTVDLPPSATVTIFERGSGGGGGDVLEIPVLGTAGTAGLILILTGSGLWLARRL